MKKLIFIILLFFQINNLYPQSGWTRCYSSSLFLGEIHFFNQDLGYLFASSGTVLLSNNGGNNWSIINTINSVGFGPGHFFDLNNYVIVGSSSNHIFGWVGIWIDGIRYDNWFNPLLGYLGFGTTSWINKDTGYVAGSDFGMSSYIGKAYRTTNRGLNWTDITPNSSLYVNCIKFLDANTGFIIQPFFEKTTNMGNNWIRLSDTSGLDMHVANNDTIYIAGSGLGRVNISTNGGTIWYPRNTGVNFGIRKIQFINSVTGWVIGSNGTIMKTTNCGVNWQMQMGGLQNVTLWNIFFLNDDYIWVTGDSGTVSGVLYRTTTGGVSFINKTGNELSEKFELYQNYPNPFNPTTSIKYQVASIKYIKLVVYNILGKEVETLVNEKQSPGIYKVYFNGSKLPSGVYFYKIQAGDFAQVKKMVLIK